MRERWWFHLRWGNVFSLLAASLVVGALAVAPEARAPAPPSAPNPRATFGARVDSTPAGLAVPMRGPLPGQKKPPCKPRNKGGVREYELAGACWHRLDGEPPCGEGWDHGAHCYSPVRAPPEARPPTSVDTERRQ